VQPLIASALHAQTDPSHPKDQLTPEALRHLADTKKWWPVIKTAGIKTQ
jgi:hypothetical protein